jgi:hypothetical protein
LAIFVCILKIALLDAGVPEMIDSDCQKNVPFAESFFATSAYGAILLCGTVL